MVIVVLIRADFLRNLELCVGGSVRPTLAITCTLSVKDRRQSPPVDKWSALLFILGHLILVALCGLNSSLLAIDPRWPVVVSVWWSVSWHGILKAVCVDLVAKLLQATEALRAGEILWSHWESGRSSLTIPSARLVDLGAGLVWSVRVQAYCCIFYYIEFWWWKSACIFASKFQLFVQGFVFFSIKRGKT
jgi:hypothetical protein